MQQNTLKRKNSDTNNKSTVIYSTKFKWNLTRNALIVYNRAKFYENVENKIKFAELYLENDNYDIRLNMDEYCKLIQIWSHE